VFIRIQFWYRPSVRELFWSDDRAPGGRTQGFGRVTASLEIAKWSSILRADKVGKTVTMTKVRDVDDYIARCPGAAQGGLVKMRAAVRSAAPGATERTDYFEMPGYSCQGFDYDGMFAWFSFKAPFIRLHVRPPVLEEHREEVADYPTTKAIVNFPMSKPIPANLVKRLVKASIKVMKDKAMKDKAMKDKAGSISSSTLRRKAKKGPSVSPARTRKSSRLRR
jgi:uncharacterized protein YdhG (YjbR/CyaY superfamily)